MVAQNREWKMQLFNLYLYLPMTAYSPVEIVSSLLLGTTSDQAVYNNDLLLPENKGKN